MERNSHRESHLNLSPLAGEIGSRSDPGEGVPLSLMFGIREQPLTPTLSERAMLVSSPQERGEGA